MLPPTPTVIPEGTPFSPLLAHPSLHCQVDLLETLSSPDQKPPRAPSALSPGISGSVLPCMFFPSSSTQSPLWANYVASASLLCPLPARSTTPPPTCPGHRAWHSEGRALNLSPPPTSSVTLGERPTSLPPRFLHLQNGAASPLKVAVGFRRDGGYKREASCRAWPH